MSRVGAAFAVVYLSSIIMSLHYHDVCIGACDLQMWLPGATSESNLAEVQILALICW